MSSESGSNNTENLVHDTIKFIDKLDHILTTHQTMSSSKRSPPPAPNKKKHRRDDDDFTRHQHKRIFYSQDLCGNE